MRVIVPLIVLLVTEGSFIARAQSIELEAKNLYELNSRDDEMFPFLSTDGTFYYTLMGKHGWSTVMYDTRRPNRAWDSARSLESIEQFRPVGAITFDSLGNAYFGSGYQGLSGSDYDIWGLRNGNASKLPSPIETKQWEAQPSISFDGKDLYYSHRIKGKQIITLCVSHSLPNGNWSEPVELGSKINFSEYNGTPFIADDGKTLFFSADRTGKLALYMATKGANDTSWSDPMPLPMPINMNDNCMSPCLSRDHKEFFFSSDREGGKGGFDLYEVKLPNGLKSLYDKMTVKW